MIEDATDEQPKKRGWPKGKARGPKRASAPPVHPQMPPTPSPTGPPAPVAPPAPAYEPVDVRGSLTNGKDFVFKCSDFNRENGNYVFVSFPATRGFKTLTILKVLDVAAISVTAPEGSLSRLLAPVAPAPVANWRPTAPVAPPPPQPLPGVWTGNPQVNTMTPPPPQIQVNPYAQAIRDSAATQAVRIPHEGGLPMSQISAGEDGKTTVVGATMK